MQGVIHMKIYHLLLLLYKCILLWLTLAKLDTICSYFYSLIKLASSAGVEVRRIISYNTIQYDLAQGTPCAAKILQSKTSASLRPGVRRGNVGRRLTQSTEEFK